MTTSTGSAGVAPASAEDTPAYTEHDNNAGEAVVPAPIDPNNEQVIGPIDTAGQDDQASVQTGQSGRSGKNKSK